MERERNPRNYAVEADGSRSTSNSRSPQPRRHQEAPNRNEDGNQPSGVNLDPHNANHVESQLQVMIEMRQRSSLNRQNRENEANRTENLQQPSTSTAEIEKKRSHSHGRIAEKLKSMFSSPEKDQLFTPIKPEDRRPQPKPEIHHFDDEEDQTFNHEVVDETENNNAGPSSPGIVAGPSSPGNGAGPSSLRIGAGPSSPGNGAGPSSSARVDVTVPSLLRTSPLPSLHNPESRESQDGISLSARGDLPQADTTEPQIQPEPQPLPVQGEDQRNPFEMIMDFINSILRRVRELICGCI